MPIYPYYCNDCGLQKDALQKISDPPLTECPSCASPNFLRQLTAAGFQLKGSGWYATDFKHSKAANNPEKPAKETGRDGDNSPSSDNKITDKSKSPGTDTTPSASSST